MTKYLPEISLRSFEYDPATRALSAMASDIEPLSACHKYGPLEGLPSYFGPMHDDACDVGIAIRSHHTNRVERFFWRESFGLDDDYVNGYKAYYFLPERGTPASKVVIFND
jgi:hypothetical protein